MPKNGIKVIGRARQKEGLAKTCSKLDATHTQTCKAIVKYVRTKYKEYGKYAIVHIANEGKRSPMLAKKLSDEGLIAGVYDYFIPIPTVKHDAVRNHETQEVTTHIIYCAGLWLEIKAKKDKLTKSQLAFKEFALKVGYDAKEAWGIDNAMVIVDEHMKYAVKW